MPTSYKVGDYGHHSQESISKVNPCIFPWLHKQRLSLVQEMLTLVLWVSLYPNLLSSQLDRPAFVVSSTTASARVHVCAVVSAKHKGSLSKMTVVHVFLRGRWNPSLQWQIVSSHYKKNNDIFHIRQCADWHLLTSGTCQGYTHEEEFRQIHAHVVPVHVYFEFFSIVFDKESFLVFKEIIFTYW